MLSSTLEQHSLKPMCSKSWSIKTPDCEMSLSLMSGIPGPSIDSIHNGSSYIWNVLEPVKKNYRLGAV